jgi:hypothetical protein
MDLECEKSEGVETIRYDTTIYDTPFSKLPDPKRVWLGSPSSTLEGLGLSQYPALLDSKLMDARSVVTPDPRCRLGSSCF